MTEENKTENKPAPRRRGKKPAPAFETDYHETVAPGPTEDDNEGRAKASADRAEKQRTATVRDGRVVERGSVIEVKTDENGIAQETVFKEIPLPGTDRVSYSLVAAKGTRYTK